MKNKILYLLESILFCIKKERKSGSNIEQKEEVKPEKIMFHIRKDRDDIDNIKDLLLFGAYTSIAIASLNQLDIIKEYGSLGFFSWSQVASDAGVYGSGIMGIIFVIFAIILITRWFRDMQDIPSKKIRIIAMTLIVPSMIYALFQAWQVLKISIDPIINGECIVQITYIDTNGSKIDIHKATVKGNDKWKIITDVCMEKDIFIPADKIIAVSVTQKGQCMKEVNCK